MRLVRAALATVVTVCAPVTVLGCSASMSPNPDTSSQAGPLVTMTDIAAQRVQLADTVAAAKWGTDSPINDPVREKAVLDAVAAKSAQLGIDPKAAQAVFTDQIEANKAVQYGLYSRWSAHPDQAPTTRPDLSQVRPTLVSHHRSVVRRAPSDSAAQGRPFLYRAAHRNARPRRAHPTPRPAARGRPRPGAHLDLPLTD